jgi:hypothetical protein
MGVQKDHDLPDDFLLSPGIDDSLLSLWANTVEFGKTFRRLLYHVKDLLPKSSHQLLGEVRPNPFDHPRAQILLDPLQCTRRHDAKVLRLELEAMRAIGDPPSFTFHVFAWRNGGCSPYDRDQVPMATDFDAQDAEARLFTVEGDAFHRASQVFCRITGGCGLGQGSHVYGSISYRGTSSALFIN